MDLTQLPIVAAAKQALSAPSALPRARAAADAGDARAQYLVACADAVRLSSDSTLAFRLGQRLRLPDHGVYGLLLMSSLSVRDYFMLAARYHLLATPTVAVEEG